MQQANFFGVHDHPAWEAYPECDVTLQAVQDTILILLSHETLHHLISVAIDHGKSQQFLATRRQLRPILDRLHAQAFGPI